MVETPEVAPEDVPVTFAELLNVPDAFDNLKTVVFANVTTPVLFPLYVLPKFTF